VPGPVSGTRRLAVILLQPDFPTAVKAEQYADTQVTANAALPGFFGTTTSDLTYNGFDARACRDLAGVRISAMDLQHPQPADLRLQLSTIGSNGEVLKTKTLFDGPNQAKGKTQKEIAAIRIAVDEDNPYSADDLIQSSTCDHFRLTVIDTVQ